MNCMNAKPLFVGRRSISVKFIVDVIATVILTDVVINSIVIVYESVREKHSYCRYQLHLLLTLSS